MFFWYKVDYNSNARKKPLTCCIPFKPCPPNEGVLGPVCVFSCCVGSFKTVHNQGKK